MSIKKCKTCGMAVSNSEEFCTECGCRCNFPIKNRSAGVLRNGIFALVVAVVYIVINVFVVPNYTGINLVYIFAFSTIICAVVSFVKDKFNNKNVLGVVISVLSIVLVSLFQHFSFLTFTVSAEEFEDSFPVSISKFVSTKGSGTVVEGNIAYVKQSKNGNVIMKMTHEQNQEILAKCAVEIANSRKEDIYISTNFDEIRVTLYSETLGTNTVSASLALNDCYLYQFFSDPNKIPEEISVKYIWIDGGNGKELLNRIVFMDEDLTEVHVTEDDVSSMWDAR